MLFPATSKRAIAYGWISIALLLVCTGCASSGAVSYGPARSASEQEAEQRLRTEVRAWEGTPHQWGGTSQRGVDCSGLILSLYADLFGLRLPRTTGEQVRQGRRVRRSNLQAGDLVFFRTSAKTDHVGVYLSNGEFAHASASQGVTVSELAQPYWQRTYWTARRLLSDFSAGKALPAVAETPSSPPATRRGGW